MVSDNSSPPDEGALQEIADSWLRDYYLHGLERDLQQLTPQQRTGVWLRLLAMRIPKFKAIDLHTSSGTEVEKLQLLVGDSLRSLTSQQ